MVPENGYAFIMAGDFGTPPDTAQAPQQSILHIFENGVELSPAHTAHADIRTYGRGRFSHWSDGTSTALYFSSSDNTDPRTNGRFYTYRFATTPTSGSTTTSTSLPTTSSTGRVFYVSPTGSDNNPGTPDAPWKTIGMAALKLAAGDTAILMDGTYEEGQITFANFGTAGKPITIRAQNKWGAVLSSVSGCNPAISIDKSYISIEDIRISVSPNNVSCTAASSSNAAVRCWGTNIPTISSPSTGVVGCTVRGVLVDASQARSVGIKTNQDYSLVENSEIHSSIEAFNNFGTIFRNNIVFGGDVWGTNISGKGGVRNFQVYNNVVHITQGNGSFGIVIGGYSGGWFYDSSTRFEAYNSVAYNNIVLNDGGAAQAGSLGMWGAKDSALYNNVAVGGQIFLYQGGTDSSGVHAQTTNPSIKNNIIVCNGNAATGGYNGWSYAGTLSVDYNDFYNCSSTVPQPHGLATDPQLVNPVSDWHLRNGSPALGAGAPLSFTGFFGENIDVTKNKDGVTRSTPWNLGVY